MVPSATAWQYVLSVMRRTFSAEGWAGSPGPSSLRDGQLRRSTVRVVDHEQRHAE